MKDLQGIDLATVGNWSDDVCKLWIINPYVPSIFSAPFN